MDFKEGFNKNVSCFSKLESTQLIKIHEITTDWFMIASGSYSLIKSRF